MVQFGDQLQSQQVTQWMHYYVDYEGLKTLLNRMKYSGTERLLPVALKKHGGNTLTLSSALSARDIWEDVDNTRKNFVRAMSVTSLPTHAEEHEAAANTNIDMRGEEDGGALKSRDQADDDDNEATPLLSNRKDGSDNGESSGVWKKLFYSSMCAKVDVEHLEVEFREKLESELQKVNVFYLGKVVDYIDTLKTLSGKTEKLIKQKDKKGLWHLQQAYIELYRHEHLLLQYSVLNYTAFWKIIKKHDKQSHIKLKDLFWETAVVQAQFIDSKQLESLIKATEKVFSNVYYDGDVRHGAMELMLKRHDHTSGDTFQLGFAIGACVALLCWALREGFKLFEHDNWRRKHALGAMSVFYSTGLLLLLGWIYGGLVYIWTKHRINYVYLLGLSPETRLQYTQVFREVSSLTMVYLTAMLFYFLEANGQYRRFLMICYPLLLILWIFIKICSPFKSGLYRTRAFVWRVIYQVILAPMGRCTFVDFFIADILTSMAKVFTELSNAACFYVTGDFLRLASGRTCGNHPVIKGVVSALPLWWRFCQCLRRYSDTQKRWPNLANALKYSLSMLALMMGVFHPDYQTGQTEWNTYRIVWVVIFVGSTLYSFWWDICMDWGLGYSSHGLLRERRLLTNKRVYYFAMVIDFVLRFVWTLTLVPEGFNPFYQYGSYFQKNMLNPFLGALELIRRGMWSVFRLESEQVGNMADGYREIPSIPLKFDAATQDIGETEADISYSRYEILSFVSAVGVLILASYFIDR